MKTSSTCLIPPLWRPQPFRRLQRVHRALRPVAGFYWA
jgi:hypothetical protein